MIIGTENLKKLKNSKIAIFGIGGVGTFVVEALARSGIGSFVLVDHDVIDITNINRQLHANMNTVGKSKVEIMKQRILDINPDTEIKTIQELYKPENAEQMLSLGYSYVVDAIDMVSSKLDLVERCHKMGIPIISSMGAGNKLNPTMLEVEDIFKTSVCPLARVMRTELRKRNIPELKVVYSKEKPITPLKLENNENRRQLPGSVSFVPSVAGLIIASEVVKDLIIKG
jgi:tRNA A37 threonylcarbamoyladenosine dehydratase